MPQNREPPTPPVVFLIWNRPECAARVLAEIAAARPAQLFVVADGPRENRPDDHDRCAQTRALLDAVNWDCEVHRNFADHNLGLRRRISSGISWAFEHVDRAIILEDDCLPDPSFFPFCADLLDRFAEDERLMQIGGSNLCPAAAPISGSYFFSSHCHIWGWATWRRAWRHFSTELDSWPAFHDQGMLDWLPFQPTFRRLFARQMERIYAGQLDTWDYLWAYAVYRHHGLSIIPRVNLISNVGFGAAATHTKDDRDPLANLPRGTLDLPLSHPENIIPCRPWETAVERRMTRGLAERAARKAARIWRGCFGAASR